MKIELEFLNPLSVVNVDGAVHRPYTAITTFTIGDFKFSGENMSNTMQVGTYATLSVAWVDKGGNTVPVQGATSWKSSDETICAVTVATGNPLIANLYAPGGVGEANIHATADADLGEGVKTVTATTVVEVIEGQAVSGDITFSQSPAQGQPQSAKGQPPKQGSSTPRREIKQ